MSKGAYWIRSQYSSGHPTQHLPRPRDVSGFGKVHEGSWQGVFCKLVCRSSAKAFDPVMADCLMLPASWCEYPWPCLSFGVVQPSGMPAESLNSSISRHATISPDSSLQLESKCAPTLVSLLAPWMMKGICEQHAPPKLGTQFSQLIAESS